MRSKNIAELAGVTPRTLRHYHEIGLLPEPVRTKNGYRCYDVQDLIRLLEIKGLANAGVALADIPSFLEGHESSTDDLLEALDKQLIDQIKRLEQQRRLVSQLRNNASAPGAGLEQPFKALTEGRSESSIKAWREQLTLYSHLLSRDDLAKLYAIYDRMAQESEALLALGRKFDALGPGSNEKEMNDLAKEYVRLFEDIFSEFKSMFEAPENIGLFKLIYAHTTISINEAQREMWNILHPT